MSIKNLFTDFRNSSKNYNEYTTDKEFFKEVESVTNAAALQLSADTFVPHLDYSRPENFIQFGSAELFYDAALTRIVDYYPTQYNTVITLTLKSICKSFLEHHITDDEIKNLLS